MSARAMTQDVYDRITLAFRTEGQNFLGVSRAAKVHVQTARKAWETGWPRRGWRPIRAVFLEEQLSARAALLREQAAEAAAREAARRKEREDARAQAVQARAQEGQLVSLARGASLAAVSTAAGLMISARKLGAQVKAYLEDEAAKAPDQKLGVDDSVDLLRRVVSINEAINRSAMQTMQMERLHLGKPTEIIQLTDAEDEEVTFEDMEARVSAAASALEAARRRESLTVIEGGGAAKASGDDP